MYCWKTALKPGGKPCLLHYENILNQSFLPCPEAADRNTKSVEAIVVCRRYCEQCKEFYQLDTHCRELVKNKASGSVEEMES
jgi:hypothetical protein